MMMLRTGRGHEAASCPGAGRSLFGLVTDESDNHAVEVEEKHDEVEAKLDEGFLLVDVQLPEDLCRIEEVSVLEDLLDVPDQQRQVEYQREPISVDKEEECQKSVHGGLGDDVGVEAVAEVDGVDVVAFQIAVHDGEENLEKEVDGIYKDREKVEPRFSRHVGRLCVGARTGVVEDAVGDAGEGWCSCAHEKEPELLLFFFRPVQTVTRRTVLPARGVQWWL